MSYDKARVQTASSKHPKPDAPFSYGTSGFRTKADLLDSVVFRVGLLAVLRSKKLHGQVVGVMITASHNPASDNGCKMIDPNGDMLDITWEPHANTLANAPDSQVLKTLDGLIEKFKIDMQVEAKVIYGVDTRPSSVPLAQSLAEGIVALGGTPQDFGLKATPQLHYLVRCVNTENTPASYGEPTEQGYYLKFATAFRTLMKGKAKADKLYIDCANGVGAPKLKEFKKVVGDDLFEIEVVNDKIDDPTVLNLHCGADHCKTQLKMPAGMHGPPGARCASFDGDADRLVYYYTDPEQDNKFCLLDGDKIASLAAEFLQDLIKQAGVTLGVGVVQTAYANGASTAYLEKSLGVPVLCTPTGVKHSHHAAQQFDIGIYFESNGHGTVLFSQSTLATLHAHEAQSPAQQSALACLRAMSELINQTVGDALSDLLMVEAILAHKGWTAAEWNACYTDLPNRLMRVVVQDPSIYKTTDAERRLTEPLQVQEKIDALVSKHPLARCFVRPSGTEACVRLYAEAQEQVQADGIALAVAGMLS